MEEQKDWDEKLDEHEFTFDSTPHNIPVSQPNIMRFKQKNSYSKMMPSFIVNSDFKRLWKKILIWVLILIAVLTVLLIYFIIYKLLQAIITGFGAIILMSLIHFILFRMIWRFFTFPGSYKIWLREVEHIFCFEATYRVIQHIEKIKTWIDILIKGELGRHQINDVVDTIRQYRNQSRIHNTDHKLILMLHDILQKTRISINNKTTNLWELQIEEIFDCDQSNTYNYEIKFEDYPRNHIAINLISLWDDIIKDLKSYRQSLNFCKHICALFKHKPFGRLDQMRNELEVRYDGMQTWATSFDGK